MNSYFAGIAFPWGVTIPSVIEPKGDVDVVRSSVLLIVLTALGERVMNPSFGTEVPLALFSQGDAEAINSMKQSVRTAIQRYDDRVEFVDFNVVKQQNTLLCTLQYKLAYDRFRDDVQTVDFQITEQSLKGL